LPVVVARDKAGGLYLDRPRHAGKRRGDISFQAKGICS